VADPHALRSRLVRHPLLVQLLDDRHLDAIEEIVEELQPDRGAETERLEIAREFMDPAPGDVPLPWDAEFHGEPDLAQPPPSASRGLPMHWVTRTVTYGPWRPVDGDEPVTTVTSGDMAVELPGIEPDKVVDLMEALEQSVAAAKDARTRHPQPGGADDRYRVRAPGGDSEGTAHPSMPRPPHEGDVWVEWDDGERGWYDAGTVERIP
jgi:hypothetical protein